MTEKAGEKVVEKMPERVEKTLQGPEPPGGAVEADAAEATRLRAGLLHLLRTDPEVKAVLAMLQTDRKMPQQMTVPAEPDAAAAAWVQTLLADLLRSTLRPDAFRRPPQ